MKNQLKHIINQLRSEGKDYTHFTTLINAIKSSGLDIPKDDILKFVADDYRIQLHTTPNSIARLISLLSRRNQPRSAIDICCGTGNILYYLQNEIADLTGVEIVENVAELTKFFIPDLQIITADSFRYPFSRKYDLVVGNLPFGMRIELDGKRIRAEEAFLRKAHQLLTENGRAIMLVPHSVLMGGTFQNFRREYVSYLEEIISLPSGVIRDTQVKTGILVIGKQKSDNVKLSDLQSFDNLDKEYLSSPSVLYPNESLNERWDLHNHYEIEKSLFLEFEHFQTKELKELADISKGIYIPTSKLREHGDYLYLKPIHIQKDGLKVDSALKYVSKEKISEKDLKYILQHGDIVISTIFNDLKMYVYQEKDPPVIASNNLAIIRSSKQDYILSYLQSDEGRKLFKKQAENLKKGFTVPHLTIKDLARIKIPILPIDDLNALGDSRISRSTESQLRDALEQLSEYKKQIQELEKERADFNSIKDYLNNRFNKVENQLGIVNQKLDDLLSLFKELKNDFQQIQKLPREEDEKLFKLCQKIDNKLDDVYNREQQTIESYIDEIKRWLDLWELLDLQSQKFLPIAEFIFDELSKLKEPDYAPFVVQYCRTLENEILKKLFEAYHKNGLSAVNTDELVKDDLEDPKTGKFAKMVKRNRVTYTLGDMNFIMALLKKGGKTLTNSPLLQHFRKFVISYFDEKIVEAEFLKDVNKLTTDFRNKAAHPYSIDINLAKDCQLLLRKSLNIFLESVRQNR